MSVNNNIISGNADFKEIATLIGSGSYDEDKICKHLNINKWATNKPQHCKDIDPSGDWRRPNSDYIYGLYVGKNERKNQYFFDKRKQGANVLGGVTLPAGYYNLNADTTSFAYKLAFGGLKDWEYQRPSGGENSPYRIGDFVGYNHAAKSPLNRPNAKQIVSYKNATVQNVPFTLGNDNSSVVGAIKLDDLLLGSINYIGLLFYTNAGKAFWVTTSKYNTVQQLRNTIPLTNGTGTGKIQIETEVWNVKTFFSTIDLGISGQGGEPVGTQAAYYLAGEGTGKYMTTLVGSGYKIKVTINPTQHKLGVDIDNITMDSVVVSRVEYGTIGLSGEYDMEGEITNNIPRTIDSGAHADINTVSTKRMFIEGANARIKITIAGIVYSVDVPFASGERSKEEFFDITT